MGACAGNDVCICNVVRIALRYDDGEGGGITTGYVTLTQEKCDIGGVEGDQMENEKDDNEW